MKSLSQPKKILFFVLQICIFFSFQSQSKLRDTDLNQQWNQLIQTSESYNEYKIIKLSRLWDFNAALRDSLNNYSSQIAQLEALSHSYQEDLDNVNIKLSQLKANLEESEMVSGKIYFLGFGISKNIYSSILWSIIILLSLIVFVVYSRIKHVCSVAKRVKAAYSRVSDDYRNHRYQAKEYQIKLKRELQTALNKLELSD